MVISDANAQRRQYLTTLFSPNPNTEKTSVVRSVHTSSLSSDYPRSNMAPTQLQSQRIVLLHMVRDAAGNIGP